MERIGNRATILMLVGIGAGIAYGAFVRGLFTANFLQGLGGVLTVSFVLVVPLALGVLTVALAESEQRRTWPFRIFMPWVPCLILNAIALVIGWEGLICILMVLPAFLVMSSLGGVFAGIVIAYRRRRSSASLMMIAFALLPVVSAPVEQKLGMPASIRTVETEIQVNASPIVVWQNIERVRKIEPNEHRPTIFNSIGFPRPVEATLSREGVGGVRHATFEGGVLFIETVTVWEPERELAFTINADTASIPTSTLDEHVTIGGKYFDMLEGSYKIEPLSNGRILLQLSSKHRLSTTFNFYAGLWTELVLSDIQRNILSVIKRRCEAVS